MELFSGFQFDSDWERRANLNARVSGLLVNNNIFST